VLIATVSAVEAGFNGANVGTPVTRISVAIVTSLHTKNNKTISAYWLAELTFAGDLKLGVITGSARVGRSAKIVGTVGAMGKT